MRGKFRRRGLWFVVALVGTLVSLGVPQTAVADAIPRFIQARASFTNPDLTVTFREVGLGRQPTVTYTLNGIRETIWACTDGLYQSIRGPITVDDPNNNVPGTGGPPTVTLSSAGGTITSSLTAHPEKAVQYSLETGWVPFTCADGGAPFLLADRFSELSLTDATNDVTFDIPGEFGFCTPCT
jgi:hypothetical protein